MLNYICKNLKQGCCEQIRNYQIKSKNCLILLYSIFAGKLIN